MADGYARATGRPGVCLAIPGPGVANALAALGEAYGDSSPVLLIAGQIDRTQMEQKKRAFHEYRDQSGMIDGVVGWRRLVQSPEEVADAVAGAFQAMTSGRPQPAVLEIPRDVASAKSTSWTVTATPMPSTHVPDELVRQTASLLCQARSPFLLAGQGVLHASATGPLIQLAEQLGAPVVTTALGRSAFPEDHPLSIGYHRGHAPPFKTLLGRSDLLLAIGTDLGEKVGLGKRVPLSIGYHLRHATPFKTLLGRSDLLLAIGTDLGKKVGLGKRIPLPPRLIHLDIRADVVGRHYPVELGLVGDASELLPRIIEVVHNLQPSPRPGIPPALRQARASLATEFEERGPREYALVRALREVLPRDAILALDAALINEWLNHAFTVYAPRTYFTPSSSGAMGFALPAALGAKTAFPGRTVVAVVGDGGFLFSAQELATGVKYGLDVIVLLFNDAAFGTIRYFQEKQFGGRIIDAALDNPDFCAFARSFGCQAHRARDPESLRAALLQSLSERRAKGLRPTLIEVPIAVGYPAH
jgi:acetolactate synthase-1/2/3 large subunit